MDFTGGRFCKVTKNEIDKNRNQKEVKTRNLKLWELISSK